MSLVNEQYQVEEGEGWKSVCVEMEGRAVSDVAVQLSTVDGTAEGEHSANQLFQQLPHSIAIVISAHMLNK